MVRNKQSPSRGDYIPSISSKGTLYFTTFMILLLALSFGLLTHYLPLSTTCDASIHVREYNTNRLATLRRSSHSSGDDGDAYGDYIFRIAVITDLDIASLHPTKPNTWLSYFKTGDLIIAPNFEHAEIHWSPEQETLTLTSQISAGGRAMELSDLAVFDGKLLTIDDRTGIIYKLENQFRDPIPWLFVNDGPGNVSKGLKGEWITVKDRHLYVGGLGKEWTTTDGVFMNYFPMYVKRISPSGEIEHLDWIERYKKLRKAVGIEWPGYMIHETGQWSEIHRKWFFMPR